MGDTDGVLELRPSCEHCDRRLGPGALEARICTFECTFCARCADDVLGGVCPNCHGELVTRPVRPVSLLEAAPPTGQRTSSPADLDAHAAALAGRDGAGDHPGVVVRRYLDRWRSADLVGLLDCYAEGFTLHYGGRSRFAGTHAGRDAAVAVLAEVSTVAPRELLDVEEVLVSDTGAAVAVVERLTRDGESHEVRRLLRYRVEGGRLAECWLLESDQELIDHLWR